MYLPFCNSFISVVSSVLSMLLQMLILFITAHRTHCECRPRFPYPVLSVDIPSDPYLLYYEHCCNKHRLQQISLLYWFPYCGKITTNGISGSYGISTLWSFHSLSNTTTPYSADVPFSQSLPICTFCLVDRHLLTGYDTISRHSDVFHIYVGPTNLLLINVYSTKLPF